MENPLTKLVTGPLGILLDKAVKVIDDLNTSGEEKLAAQRELLKAQQDFHVEMAKLDADWSKTQASVIMAEATGASWIQRNWRPLTMLSFVTVILYQFFIGPLFNLRTVETLPENLWTVIQIGLGGYVFGRTAEKIAPQVTSTVTEVLTRKK